MLFSGVVSAVVFFVGLRVLVAECSDTLFCANGSLIYCVLFFRAFFSTIGLCVRLAIHQCDLLALFIGVICLVDTFFVVCCFCLWFRCSFDVCRTDDNGGHLCMSIQGLWKTRKGPCELELWKRSGLFELMCDYMNTIDYENNTQRKTYPPNK